MKQQYSPVRRWRRKTKLYGGLLILMILCYMFWWEPDSLYIQQHQLELSNWTHKLDDLKIVVLSDLHMGAPYMNINKLQEIVNKTNQQQAALIVISGDLVAHKVLFKQQISLDLVAQTLSKLQAPLGVWVVLGNHDYWAGIAPIKAALQRHYVRVLEDQSVLLNSNGQDFWLVGISDAWEGLHDINKALYDIPAEDPVIAFTHNPDLFPEIPSRVNLTIAGHTHGGQVRLAFINNPFLPSKYGDRYIRGHIKEQGHDLFVSTGLGTSVVPIRLGVPPEISVLTLTATNAHPK